MECGPRLGGDQAAFTSVASIVRAGVGTDMWGAGRDGEVAVEGEGESSERGDGGTSTSSGRDALPDATCVGGAVDAGSSRVALGCFPRSTWWVEEAGPESVVRETPGRAGIEYPVGTGKATVGRGRIA